MEVLKTINNNIVVSLDQKNREMIVMGRGLGFKKKAGDTIEEDKIEKIFTLNDKKSNTNFRKLVDDVPMERILVASEIIEYAKKSLQKELSENIYGKNRDRISESIWMGNQEILLSRVSDWKICN